MRVQSDILQGIDNTAHQHLQFLIKLHDIDRTCSTHGTAYSKIFTGENPKTENCTGHVGVGERIILKWI